MKDFAHPTIEVFLSWPTPNYVNPEKQGQYVTPASIAITSLSIVVVLGRFWSRGVITRHLGIDDWSMLLSLIFCIVMAGLIIYQELECDIGVHFWDFPLDKAPITRKTLFALEWIYSFASFFARFSVLIFYRRLQSGTHNSRFIWATWIGIGYNVLFTLHIPIFLLLIYRPINAYWLSGDVEWESTHKYWYGREDIGLILNGAMSTVGDTCTMFIPFFLVRSLQMSEEKKLRLYFLFSSGFIVIAAGALRTWSMVRVVSTYDTTWRLPETWIWTVVEMNATIITGSIPAMKPLASKIVSTSRNYIRRTSSSSQQSPSTSTSNTSPRKTKANNQRRGKWSIMLEKTLPSLPHSLSKTSTSTSISSPISKTSSATMTEESYDMSPVPSNKPPLPKFTFPIPPTNYHDPNRISPPPRNVQGLSIRTPSPPPSSHSHDQRFSHSHFEQPPSRTSSMTSTENLFHHPSYTQQNGHRGYGYAL